MEQHIVRNPSVIAIRTAPGRLADRVRNVLGRVHGPVSAYVIAEMLQNETGRRHFPNSIYRSLRLLAAEGEVIQVVSAHGWLLRTSEPFAPIMLLLCNICGGAEQIGRPQAANAIAFMGTSSGFSITGTHIEVLGTCRNCVDGPVK